MAQLGDFVTQEAAGVLAEPLMVLSGPELQVVIRAALCLWIMREHGLTMEEAKTWTDKVGDEIGEHVKALLRRRADQN